MSESCDGVVLRRRLLWAGVALMGLLFCLLVVRNLPWHLDDKDQAKQAYIAVEMVEFGGEAWWFQHTPDGDIATKPPLMGWLNAGLRGLGMSWDLAWRLPGLVVALAMAWGLFLWGRRQGWGWLALLPMAAFGFNLLTPRLAMLVRTDLLLAGAVGLVLMVLVRGMERREDEARGDGGGRVGGRSLGRSWVVCLALALAAMLKGPIAWVFVLPGVVVYELLAWRVRSWALPRLPVYWWAYVLSLLPFLAWSLLAMRYQEGFYEQVVLREFLGRFEGGENATHNVQPWFYYLGHLAKAFAPWFLGLVVVSVMEPRLWRRLWREPSLLLMACCGLAALVVMSAVPSKRLDRVFPLVLPLVMVAAGVVAGAGLPRVRRLAAGVLGLGVLVYVGYGASMAWQRTDEGQGDFTADVRKGLPVVMDCLGVDARAGEVVATDNDVESLFVWQPHVGIVGFDELKRRVAEQGVKLVLVNEANAVKLTRRFPEAQRMMVLARAPERKYELWVYFVGDAGEDG